MTQIDRLPPTDELVGQTLTLVSPGEPTLELSFISPDQVVWRSDGRSGAEGCEVIEVTPDVFFIDMTFMERPREALSVIVDMTTRRSLQIRSIVREEEVPGEHRVVQVFHPGVLEGGVAKGEEPALAGDLGLAVTYRFAPDQYVSTSCESELVMASVYFLDFKDRRSTGKILGITADGRVFNRPASYVITQTSMISHSPEASPA